MRLGAGGLRTRGTIESPVETPDASGDLILTWSPHAVVWADVEALSGRELFTAQQDASLVQYRVTTRYVAGVTAKMRFRVGTQTLDIEAVLPDPRYRVTTLNCMERLAGA